MELVKSKREVGGDRKDCGEQNRTTGGLSKPL